MCIGPKVRLKPMSVSQNWCRAPAVVEEVAEHLGPPEVEAAEEPEERATEDHVVEVGDDVVRVGLLGVGGGDGVGDAGQTADGEHRHEADREQHAAW